MNKAYLSNFLRIIGLIYMFDQLRFYLQKIKNRKANQQFRDENPEVSLPPDYLIYESFQLNYHKYFVGGRQTAESLVHKIEKHQELKQIKILDWGCGPGRIIRHFPDLLPYGNQFFGTDYNEKSIKWCSQHLKGINFNKNNLEARLPYADNFFDVIYGISTLTHLSESMHFSWVKELHRVLKNGGILLLTTHGENFLQKLTFSEIEDFKKGNLVVRGKVKEGHRTYSAFQPKLFMQKLFEAFVILEHHVEKPATWIPQDMWILRKK